MTPEFKEKVQATVAMYEQWSAGQTFKSCRLVHYCGVDKPNAVDVPLGRVRDEIVGCLEEGFAVGWYAEASRLYIFVQEPGCPVPPRDKVVAEEALADVDAILRIAGFDSRA